VSTALALSAGGMYAAWEVGVWKVVRDHAAIDGIVGASAGAWNAWSIAGGATPEELCEAWLDPLLAHIMRKRALHEKAHELFRQFQPRMPVGLALVELPNLRVHTIPGERVRERHLAAAVSIPGWFPPVKIEGRWYVDGGFRAGLPLVCAEEMGATRAIALNVLTAWPFRLLRRVMWRPDAGQLDVVRIEPSERLGSLKDAVVWRAENVRRWIALGEKDGRAAIPHLRI